MANDNTAKMAVWRDYIDNLIEIAKINSNLYQGRRHVIPPDLSSILGDLNPNTFDSLDDSARSGDRFTLEMRNHDQVASTLRLKTIVELTRKDYYMNAQQVARHHIAYLQLMKQQAELWNLRTDTAIEGIEGPVIDVFSGEEVV